VEEPAPPPRSINPDISPEFERVLLRCLAKAPEERPATGEQLADELEQLLTLHRDPGASRTLTVPATNTPTLVSPVTAARRAAPVRRHSSARVIVPGALVVVGAAVAGMLLLASQQDGGASPAPPDSTIGSDTSTVDTLTGVTVVDTGSVAGRRGGGAPRPDAGPRGRPTPTHGAIVFSAPPGARLSVDGRELSDTVARLDTTPGMYTVTATVLSIPGCSSNTVNRAVDLRAGATQNVNLNPRPCGWLEIEGEGRRGNQRVDGLTRYRILSGTNQIASGILPLKEPLVLPVGRYEVIVSQATCADNNAIVTISAEQRAKVGPAWLICG
jgi:hypothetical protein